MNVAKIWIYSDIGALQHPFSSLGTDCCNKQTERSVQGTPRRGKKYEAIKCDLNEQKR